MVGTEFVACLPLDAECHFLIAPLARGAQKMIFLPHVKIVSFASFHRLSVGYTPLAFTVCPMRRI